MEAADILKNAQDQFIKIGNWDGEAQCLCSLGNILCMQDNYEEAADAMKKARDQFVKISSPIAVAQCSQSLGNILCKLKNYKVATDPLEFTHSGSAV